MKKRDVLRGFLVLPLLPALLLMVLLTTASLLWWESVGILLRLVPGQARRVIGRYLGAVPFAWLLTGTLQLAALTAWSIRGGRVKARFADMAEGCICQLEDIPRLREIGGFW